MRVLLGLAPVACFLGALMALDSYKLVKLHRVLAILAAGAVLAGLSYFINGALLVPIYRHRKNDKRADEASAVRHGVSPQKSIPNTSRAPNWLGPRPLNARVISGRTNDRSLKYDLLPTPMNGHTRAFTESE